MFDNGAIALIVIVALFAWGALAIAVIKAVQFWSPKVNDRVCHDVETGTTAATKQ